MTLSISIVSEEPFFDVLFSCVKQLEDSPRTPDDSIKFMARIFHEISDCMEKDYLLFKQSLRNLLSEKTAKFNEEKLLETSNIQVQIDALKESSTTFLSSISNLRSTMDDDSLNDLNRLSREKQDVSKNLREIRQASVLFSYQKESRKRPRPTSRETPNTKKQKT